MEHSNFFGRVGTLAVATLATAALVACGGGGGGGGGSSEPAATAIPSNLTIPAPAAADTASGVQFGNSAASLSGLKYSWDFGDGSTSTEAGPTHSYAKSGDFKVTLRVTNQVGTSSDTQYNVSVTNLSLVQGLVCSGAKQSGWCWEQPTPAGTDRYDTFFIDANTGWTVGASGTILKTTDAGKTWQSQSSGIDAAIRLVRFADANNGWAQGDYGAILRTTDGGASWTVSKPTNNYYGTPSLQFLDAKTLLIKDNSGNVLSSADGGVNWKTSTFVPAQISKAGVMWALSDGMLSKSVDLGLSQTQVLDARPSNYNGYPSYSFLRADDQHLLVSRSSQNYVNGTWVYYNDYWRTQDGGATWDTPAMQGMPAGQYGNNFSLVYAGPGVLLVTINNLLYRSGDMGASWAPVTAAFAGNNYFNNTSFFGLADGQLMFYQYGSAYLSQDAGKTWAAMKVPGVSGSYSTYSGPIGTQALGAQGMQLNFNDGSSYRSSDSGQTWTTILGPTTVPNSSQMRAFWAVDAKHALGVNSSGQLMESKDGGHSWALKQSGGYAGYTPRIMFASAKVGWLYIGDGRLYRSTDGGDTWVTGVSSNFYAQNFQFLDENNGFAAINGRLNQTKDGGLGWLDVAALPPNVTQVVFQDASHGLALSYNGVAETSDGGLTWVPRYTGGNSYFLNAVYTDAKTVWAIAQYGGVLQSTDGGTTWRAIVMPVNNLEPAAIQFIDVKHGWIVGSNGIVVATSDGGKTWQRQATAITGQLQAVQFVDSQTGWILGSTGALLATGTGGN